MIAARTRKHPSTNRNISSVMPMISQKACSDCHTLATDRRTEKAMECLKTWRPV